MPAPIDARVARTQQQLRSAALTLAAEAPIESISVADLAREAGINRATFYKHADSPTQLLWDALVEDLDVMRAGFLEHAAAPTIDFVALWRQAAHDTAAHVARFEGIYRQGCTEGVSGAVHALLSRHIAVSMQELFERNPTLLPKRRPADRALLAAAYASYLGHGLTAILREWFCSGAEDVDVYADAVINALPTWMLLPQPAAPRPRTPRNQR